VYRGSLYTFKLSTAHLTTTSIAELQSALSSQIRTAEKRDFDRTGCPENTFHSRRTGCYSNTTADETHTKDIGKRLGLFTVCTLLAGSLTIVETGSIRFEIQFRKFEIRNFQTSSFEIESERKRRRVGAENSAEESNV